MLLADQQPNVAVAIYKALGLALLDYWYVWLLMLAVGIALAWLKGVADRAEARADARRGRRPRPRR